MRQFSHRERIEALERMAAEGVDVLVIGGGITGAGVAMDAAARGYRVGLVEKGDFASGTSSKSTKLIHGGIRYLPQRDFALVREALEERRLLFQNAPWLVEPLGFVIPIYRWSRKPLGLPFTLPGGLGLSGMIGAGLTAYDLLSGADTLPRHRQLSTAEVHADAPCLQQNGLKDAFLYYDGRTDDVRLTLAVLRTAAAHGAWAANYAAVESFDIQEGRIQAALVHDQITGQQYRIPARHVVNAGGVFAQRVEELTGLPSQLRLEAAKGVHLLVSRERVPMTDHAVVLPETDDGRLLFLIPWFTRVLIGTTDTVGGDIDAPRTTAEDVRYLLDHCRRYLNVELTPEDIISTFAGFRPLVKTGESDSAALSRSHIVHDGPAGMTSIVGGKLTTWRRMAEDTMNHLAARDGKSSSSVTHSLRLDDTDTRSIAAIADADPLLAQRILPDLPYVLAEAVAACRFDMALTLDDVMARRTRLALLDINQGRTVAPEVAALMADELGWDAAETDRQMQDYTERLRHEYRQE